LRDFDPVQFDAWIVRTFEYILRSLEVVL
jgi:hypothetical protein